MAQALVLKRDTGIRSGAGTGITFPALYRPDAATAKRVLEFFTANIRNPNTRKAYAKATLKSGKENQDIHTQSEPSLIFIPPEHGPIVPPQSAA